jgi:myo-inositol-1-phosphate synthase
VSKLKIAVAGVGNNIAALHQGVQYYKALAAQGVPPARWPSVRHPVLRGIGVDEVEIVAAFDVDPDKIGLPVREAIFAGKNNYPRLALAELPEGCTVQRGLVGDDDIGAMGAVRDALVHSGAEVLLYSLPTGLQRTAEAYAQAALEARVGLVNCTPEKLARLPSVLKSFQEARLPLIGDDLASHFGSSVLHKTLIALFEARGVTLEQSYQINVGGNEDFKNLAANPGSKKESKFNALGAGASVGKVEVIPSAGVLEQLQDHKVAYFNFTGQGWAGTVVELDVKLKVQDSSNAAGVIIDLIRIAGANRRLQMGGFDADAAAILKSPPPPAAG